MLTGHYRGGLQRGTNLSWEILGTDGEITVTAPTGHVQVQPLALQGGRHGDAGLHELRVPSSYARVAGLDPVRQSPAFIVAHTYEQLLRDVRDPTSVLPSWTDAARRHASIELTT